MSVESTESDGQPRETIPGLPESEIVLANQNEQADPANLEAIALSGGLSRGELEKLALVAEHGRNEKFRNQFEILAIIALWLSALVIAACGLIWVAHMVLPEGCRWLSKDEVSHLQSIVTAGLLVGVIGNHFKKRLGK